MAKKFRLAIAILLFLPISAFASLSRYEILFSPSIADLDLGFGSFYWNDATHIVSGLNWDFGGGDVGGAYDWVFDRSFSEFFFELMTQQDVDPTSACSDDAVSCSVTIYDGGFYGYPGESISFSEFDWLPQYRLNDSPALTGSFTVRLASSDVPEPGTFTLLGTALLSAMWWKAGARRT